MQNVHGEWAMLPILMESNEHRSDHPIIHTYSPCRREPLYFLRLFFIPSYVHDLEVVFGIAVTPSQFFFTFVFSSPSNHFCGFSSPLLFVSVPLVVERVGPKPCLGTGEVESRISFSPSSLRVGRFEAFFCTPSPLYQKPKLETTYSSSSKNRRRIRKRSVSRDTS